MSQSTAPRREVAQRTFAREFNAATHTFSESDDDRAPVYVLLPTGAKANRVFIVGTLTETTDVGSEEEYWQGRIVDPTGTVFVYAGQYQPEATSMLRDTEPPAFVAVVGKPRTYETDDGTVNVSLRPEHVTIVDEVTRHRWVTETAVRTIERLKAFDDTANEYARLVREHYADAVEPCHQAVIEAMESLDTGPAETAGATADTAATRSERAPDDAASSGPPATGMPSLADERAATSDTGDDRREGDASDDRSERE